MSLFTASMSRAPKPSSGVVVALGIAMSVVAYLIGRDAAMLWPLACLAPVPLILARFQSRWWVAALCVGVAYMFGMLDPIRNALHSFEAVPRRASNAEVVWVLSVILGYALIALLARYTASTIAAGFTSLAIAWALLLCAVAATSNRSIGTDDRSASGSPPGEPSAVPSDRCITVFDMLQFAVNSWRNTGGENFCELQISRRDCVIIRRSCRAPSERAHKEFP